MTTNPQQPAQDPKASGLDMGDELEEVLAELWEYGFNSGGDFPTEYRGRYQRVDEAKAALNALYLKRVLSVKPKQSGSSYDIMPTATQIGYDRCIYMWEAAITKLLGEKS